jgi:hypothetical protein
MDRKRHYKQANGQKEKKEIFTKQASKWTEREITN